VKPVLDACGGKMQIVRIDVGNQDATQRFFEFPFHLYRNDPHWVPPMASERASIFGGHPFYEHSEAEYYLAENQGKVLGRIGVMHNRNHNAYRKCRTAFFGFFECVEDNAVAQDLFAAAFEWARARRLDEVIGPRGLMGSDGGGILVEGFEHRAALNENYNPPYYDRLVVQAGFHKDRDHLSGYLPGDYILPERFYRIAGQVSERRGFTIQSFRTAREVRAWVPKVAAVHQKAFVENHEYFPPSPAEVKLLTDSILMVADPRLLKLVLHAGEVVGFIIAYHDIAPALQRSGGRIWLLGWWHILQERRRAEWVNVNGIGALPEYRGLGANTLLYSELQKTVHAFGFKHIEVIQVDEFNFKSKSDMEAIGVQWYKRHRSYRFEL
jgi:GNAT superfamily N-acetyltransferase